MLLPEELNSYKVNGYVNTISWQRRYLRTEVNLQQLQIHGLEENTQKRVYIKLLQLQPCTLPAEIIQLPNLEKLYLENNRLSVLPPELGELKSLKILAVDYNTVPRIGKSFVGKGTWEADLQCVSPSTNMTNASTRSCRYYYCWFPW
ncbi:hypothetical protein D5086_032679 [Populus alba]|uniref:Uncharacterized protein n=1 Tax=Populus alba TaxID=43335 RepID=A0ACC4AFM9_POPAL